MSYVVLSNTTNDNERLTGISSAESFQNNFKSPLIVEPNSEIAVESIKINRKDNFDITADDEFFVYFGEELADATPSGSNVTNGVKIDIPVGSYTRKSFAATLQDLINAAPLNPAIYKNATVTVQQSAGNEFDGFKFTFARRDTGDNTDYMDGSTFTDARLVAGNSQTLKLDLDEEDAGSESRGFEWTVASSTLNCCRTSSDKSDYLQLPAKSNFMRAEACARCQFPPLANSDGLFVVDLNNASQNSWMVGLSRPTSTYYNDGFPRYLARQSKDDNAPYKRKPQVQTRNTAFCDFWVEFSAQSGSNTGGEDKLFVKHWGKTTVNQWAPKQIAYWTNGSSNFSSQIDTAKISGSSLRYLIWKLSGNELKVYLSQTATITSGKTFPLVDSASLTTDAQYNFAPLGNGEEWLSPVINMTESGQSMVLETYQSYSDLLNTTSFPTIQSPFIISSFEEDGTTAKPDNNYPLLSDGVVNVLVGGSDWWSRAEADPTGLGLEEIRFNELRPATLYYANASAPSDYRYKNLSGSNCVDYKIVLVPNKEFVGSGDVYKQKLYVIPSKLNNANMGRIMGFSTFSQITQSDYGSVTASGIEIDSINAGVFAVSSAFVRINDLPIQSFNGAKQSRSNIVYHIPRFTNDGTQFGELYFAVPEKTYIKMNNTDKITLNQMKVDIIDRNERIVEDLQGGTIVVVHIRPSK